MPFKKLWGFEPVLVLFLFSYQIKNIPFFESLPDLTTSLAFFLIPWGIWIAWRESHLKTLYTDKTLLCLIALWGWMIWAYFWGPQTFLAQSKIWVHSLFTMPVVLYAALFIGQSDIRIQRLLKSLVLFALPVVGGIFYLYFTNQGAGFVFGANYLTTGQTLGIALIIAYIYGLDAQAQQNYKTYLLYLLLGSLLLFSLLQTGGRGPLVFTLLSLCFLAFTYHRNSILKNFFLIGIIISLTAFQTFFFRIFIPNKESDTLKRLGELYDQTSGSLDESTATRLDYYSSAWQAFTENIFTGLGIGGWPPYFGEEVVDIHPHNILLEIGAELGLVGLALFGGACGWLALKIWPRVRGRALSPQGAIFLGFLCFTGLNALKSGDLNDNIFLFFAITLCSAYTLSNKKAAL